MWSSLRRVEGGEEGLEDETEAVGCSGYKLQRRLGLRCNPV